MEYVTTLILASTNGLPSRNAIALQRSANNPRPSTLNHQPSTLNLRPSTLDPQPSTLDPRPSTLNPQPSTLDPQLGEKQSEVARNDPKPQTLN